MSNNESDRREYFRIRDKVSVSIKKLTTSESLDDIKSAQTSFLLGSAISAIDLENQALFNKIKRNHPDISQYFDIVNKKIDLISNHILATSLVNNEQLETEIDLSASGIAIENNNGFSKGELVLIKLLLLPERKGIICTGRIIRTNDTSSNSKCLCIDFEEISDSDREIIVKHTISKQLLEARDKKKRDY